MASTATQKSIDWAYSPLPTQSRFHADIRTPFKGYSGPVGSGKSFALAYEAIFLSILNPGLMGLLGSPTFPMMRDVTSKALFEALDAESIPYWFHKSSMMVTLPSEPFHGATIILRAVTDYERLRGTNLAWFGVDELTYCPRASWERLQARLRDPRANRLCGFATWTPKGFDYVYEMFILKPLPGYKAYLASPRENFYVAKSGMYENLQASYDERFYRQEALGEYLNVFQGQVYYAFDRHRNVKPVEYDPTYPLCWSLDFNVDPMCSIISQVIPMYTRHDAILGLPRDVLINVIDEIVIPNSNTPQACDEFVSRASRLARGRGPMKVVVYGDAAGGHRSTLPSSVGAKSDWEEIRRFFSRNGSDFQVTYKYQTSNPLVRDRVNAMNGALRNAAGETRLFINSRCEKLTKDFERVAWKPGTTQIDKDSDSNLTHLTDALGYQVETELGIATPGGYRKGIF